MIFENYSFTAPSSHSAGKRHGGDYGEINRRWDKVRRIYSWPSDAEALELLKKLKVRYAFMGALEREYYDAAALARLGHALHL